MNIHKLYSSETSDFLIEHFNEIILITDNKGIIINHNALAESFFKRYPLKGLATKDVFELQNAKGNHVDCPVLKCIYENQTIEHQEPLLLNQNNKYVNIKAIPIIIENKAQGCLLIIKDINQTEKLKSDNQKDRQILSTLFDNAPLGIAVIDTKGNILEINPTMLTILGSPSANATKQINLLQFKPLQETPLPNIFNKVLETKSSVSDTAKYITKWGKLIYVYYQLVPIIQNNEVHQLLLYINDLTPVYNAQEKEMLIKNKIALLHQFSYEFITLNNSYDPYVFIGEKVKTLFPDCTITINKYQPTKNFFVNEYIYSPNKEVQEFSNRLKNNKTLLSFTLPNELWPLNFQGKLIQIPHEDFLTVNFSIKKEELISLIINAQVKSIYSMGFINNSMLLGNITLFTHKEEEENIEILEVLINQASLLLQRHLSQKKSRKAIPFINPS